MDNPFYKNNQFCVIFTLMKILPNKPYIYGFPNPFYFINNNNYQVQYQNIILYYMQYMNYIINANKFIENNRKLNKILNNNINLNNNNNLNNNCNYNIINNNMNCNLNNNINNMNIICNNNIYNNNHFNLNNNYNNNWNANNMINMNNMNNMNNNIFDPFPELSNNNILPPRLVVGGSVNYDDKNNNNNNNNNNNKSTTLILNNMNIALISGDKKTNYNNNFNEEISIIFEFSDDPPITIKAKLNEKFDDILDKLSENNNEIWNKYDKIGIHNCNLIRNESTLKDNNIKNGDFILFLIKTKKEKEKEKEKEMKENIELDKDEIEQLQKWLIEYRANKLCEYHTILHNYENPSKIPKENLYKLGINKGEFVAFVFYKESKHGIMTREHNHILVFILNNYDWKCNICNNNYNKKEGKYYCSLCDYNMCDRCRAQGYYNKKRSFPKDMPINNINFKNKFIKRSVHEHHLVFCRTSRIVLNPTPWYCNICSKEYDNDVWSFYCTNCDYDLCSKCAGIHGKIII